MVRYLVKCPYLKRVFEVQDKKGLKVQAMSDSDWAGDLRTRKSTTGCVVKLGNHTVMAKSTSQKVVALSSAESEFYGMCRTATLAEFVRGIVSFWGVPLETTELQVDSSAAKSMSERKGVGKTRHIQAKYLWLQDQVFSKQLLIKKVKGNINDADLMTKVQPAKVIKDHLKRMGFHSSGRKGHKGLA